MQYAQSLLLIYTIQKSSSFKMELNQRRISNVFLKRIYYFKHFSFVSLSLIFDLVLHTLPNGVSIGPDAQLLQSQIAVIQQHQQQQKLLHNALTRTVSHQPTTVDLPLLPSVVDAMQSNENHRKLERTQSEPAPQSQVNTSR